MEFISVFVNFLTFAFEVALPIAEVAINVVNVVNINEMINDPDSGYGNGNVFDDLFQQLNPVGNGNIQMITSI